MLYYFSIQSERVAIGGTCERNRQCKGTAFANVCDHDVCSCRPGYIQIGRKCYPGKTSRVYYDKYNFLVKLTGKYSTNTKAVHIYFGNCS